MERELTRKHSTLYDFIVIGGGPAGLAAAQYAARSNLSTLLIEASQRGGQLLKIANLENYPGVYPAISGNNITQAMKTQASDFGATFITARVRSIDKIGNQFALKTDAGEFTALSLCLASGALHRKLGIPGEYEFENRGLSYCALCDGAFFKNRKIAVIGGGDSACEGASYLSRLSSDVTLIHRKEKLRAQRGLAQKVLNSPTIKILFNTQVQEIQGSAKAEYLLLQNTKTGQEQRLPVDGIFVYAGMEPQTQLIEMLPMDTGGYVITDENMKTPIEGLYAAGDIRSKPLRQLVTAVSDGAIAAYSAQIYVSGLKKEVPC